MTAKDQAANQITLFSILSVVIGLLLGLVGLELALRLASQLNQNISIPPRQPRELRIVTLGESTTESFGKGSVDISWPAQLSKVLERHISESERPFAIKVINLGRGASSTPYLVSHFQENVDRLDPDVVITMMGVNDSYAVKLSENFFFRNSYLFKLIFWTVHFGSCGECFNYTHELSQPERNFISEDRTASEIMNKLLTLSIRSDMELDASRLRFEEWAKPFPLKKALLEYVYASRLLQTINGHGRRGDADAMTPSILKRAVQEAMQRSRPYVLKSSQVFVGYCNLLLMSGESCLPELMTAFKDGLQPRAALLTVALQHGAAQNSEFKSILLGLGLDIDVNRNFRTATRDNFRALADLAREHSFKLYVMQYPTGTLDGVRSFFMKIPDDFFPNFQSAFYWINNDRFEVDQRYSVNYIDNSNFDLAVQTGGTREYFTDMFGMGAGLRFGHATEKGNHLIAENAARALLPVLSEFASRKTSP